MKEALYVVGWVVAIVLSIASLESCTPAQLQTLDTLNETSLEAAKLCVQISKCIGMDKMKIGPYCQLAEDALEMVDKITDDYCPLPAKDAGRD
jgi:hypothetical protein